MDNEEKRIKVLEKKSEKKLSFAESIKKSLAKIQLKEKTIITFNYKLPEPSKDAFRPGILVDYFKESENYRYRLVNSYTKNKSYEDALDKADKKVNEKLVEFHTWILKCMQGKGGGGSGSGDKDKESGEENRYATARNIMEQYMEAFGNEEKVEVEIKKQEIEEFEKEPFNGRLQVKKLPPPTIVKRAEEISSGELGKPGGRSGSDDAKIIKNTDWVRRKRA